MRVLRTPDERFEGLPGFSFAPHYVDVSAPGCPELRMHYLDEGPSDAAPVLLLHGQPSWCYLYRKMIGPLVRAGHRVVAPDLIGFGRSDKPATRSDYTYQRHVDWLHAFVDTLDLRKITLFCQDWGGLIGLRVFAEQPERFARVIAANTFLPTGKQQLPEAFFQWRAYSQAVPELPVGGVLQRATVTDLSDDVVAAYDAPFPDETYKEGARQFPVLVPATPDDPASAANEAAWQFLSTTEVPFLTAFSDRDPITRGGDTFVQAVVPGCRGLEHVTVSGAGHFLQEDKGPELAYIVNDFIEQTQEGTP
jgi:haloalkane dehalogenase